MPTGRTLVYSTMIRVVVAQQTQVGVASATARFAAAPGNFAAIGAVGCWAIKTYRLYHSHYYGLTTTACLEMPTMQFLHEFKNRHFCTLSDWYNLKKEALKYRINISILKHICEHLSHSNSTAVRLDN